MKLLRRYFTRIANLAARRRADARMKEEIEEHLAQQTADNLRAGMPPQEARRQAVLKFGAVEAVKEAYQAEHGMLFIESLWNDLRYASRILAKSPGFAAIAILTLALGIGANTAIFSVTNAVLFRSLPAQDPEHLVVFSWTAHHQPTLRGNSTYGDCAADCSLSVPLFQAMRTQANTFSGVAAFAGPLQVSFSGNGPANIASGEFVSGDFFSTVGVKTMFGRPLGPADDTPSAFPAIVLSHGFWQRAFGGDPSAVGRTIRLNSVEALIVGVADLHFTSLTPGKSQDFFMPLSLSKQVRGEYWSQRDRLADPAIWWVVLIARLKPGVSIDQAQAAATAIFSTEVARGTKPLLTMADSPAIHLLPAREALNGASSQIAPILALITVAVGFVLLIACANVAGLILARSARRQKEFAMRQALGARRGRIARQLLTESVLLSVAGGTLGILVAFWGVSLISKLVSNGLNEPFPFVIAPDWRVLAFTVFVTLATGILSGLAPTLRSSRADLTPSLRENASSAPGAAPRSGQRFRFGDALVVAQVALSIVVLFGAGLLVRTLRNLQSVDPGFDTRNVLLFGINPTLPGYKDREIAQLYQDLQQRFSALPGVVSVSYSADALLSQSWSGDDIHLDGAPPKSNVSTATLDVGPDFFSAMRIPVLAGRTFTPPDFTSAASVRAAMVAAAEAESKSPADPAAPHAPSAAKPADPQLAPVPVLINQAFAQKFFPNRNPLGMHVGNAQNDEPAEGPQVGFRIVGIVGDTRYSDLRHEIQPTMYSPLVGSSAHFELRTAGDPATLTNAVRQVVAGADSNLPLFDVRTQSEQIEKSLFNERILSQLSGFFALLALALACIGLYGLLSYEVTRRTRELGIRMALGARKQDLMRLVVRQGVLLALIGAALGIGAAMGVTRFMASMLYNVRSYDPATIAAVAVLLTLVAFAACFIPARRAMHVDPMVALRQE